MKMAAFWFVAPCSLVQFYRRFKGTCCLIAVMIEAASISETSANFYKTTRRYNPEDSHLQPIRLAMPASNNAQTTVCIFTKLSLQYITLLTVCLAIMIFRVKWTCFDSGKAHPSDMKTVWGYME
jgi:hypothetical protein